MREKLSDSQVRLEGLENSIEVMMGYLRDLKEVMIGKDEGDKGKTPTDLGPSTTPVINLNNATPTEKGSTPIRNPSPRIEEEEGGEETSEIRQKGVDCSGRI